MNTTVRRNLFILVAFVFMSCNVPGDNPASYVLMKTSLGDITIRLYDNTPIHRDNFKKLVTMGYYEGILFHRVIRDFMIQAGDPSTRTGLTPQQIDTLSSYTIPAEFRSEYYHKKGALAAARQGNDVNPEMRSSGTQFYIVQGKKHSEDELKATQERINSGLKQALFGRLIKEIADSARQSGVPMKDSEVQEKASVKMFEYLTGTSIFNYSDEQLSTYMNIGGVPRLDATYTVFGEVTEGLEIVDKIASVATDPSDKPLEDVRILKMKLVSK